MLTADETVDSIVLTAGVTLGNGQIADVPVDTVGLIITVDTTTVGAQ